MPEGGVHGITAAGAMEALYGVPQEVQNEAPGDTWFPQWWQYMIQDEIIAQAGRPALPILDCGPDYAVAGRGKPALASARCSIAVA